MYRNFSSVYRRLYGYAAASDSSDPWDSWYRPRWYDNYTRPDYTSNWRLWDPLTWVEDDEPTPTPTPSPAATPTPTGTPEVREDAQPLGSTEPEPRTGTSPQPADGTPPPAGTPQPASETPKPAGTPQPEPAHTPEPASGSPQPAGTPEPQPGSGSPQPAGTPQPEPAGTPEPEPASGSPQPAAREPTEILGVDLLEDANRGSHHTASYFKRGLLVRRGQEFDVEIKLNKQWTKEDTLRLQLSIGSRPHLNYNTLLLLSPGNENNPREACVVIKDIADGDGGSTVRMSVNLASDCPVGQYTVVVIARKKEDEGRRFTKYLLQKKIIVLFNPWSKDDEVYIDGDDERNEYVMNESGRIFTSSSLWHKGKPWTFGQFQESVLDAALYLLERSKLPTQAWGNPVRVSRQLSAMVNSNDESGVLSGNWSGDYAGGTSPTSWSGSVKILQQYMDTKSPVKWGQCWVFSGVLTTVCRALGIPTRSVTNFESAHDSDESMTIDTFYDEDGNPLRHLNDSVWNFHVWNEAWFLRPDIPGDYGGWQAFDSTPQERSEYVFQCGPAPLKAIREGSVHLGYDAKFIFAEVNGDQITWTKYRDGTLKATDRITGEVGKYISTKDVLKDERKIITDLYKYKEGSDEEREAVARAYQLSSRRRDLDTFYDYEKNDDVEMTFKPEMNDDGTARFLFTAKNNANEKRTLKCRFTAMATYYTGVTANELDRAKKRLVLRPGKEKEFSWQMVAAHWINKAAEDATVGIYAYVHVKETGQRFAKKTILELNKPELELTFEKTTIKRGDDVVLSIGFTNPLDLELTKCSITVEGTGFKPVKEHLGDVAANGDLSASVTLTSLLTGRQDVNATFHSRQLVNISGSATVTVTE